MSWNRGKKGMDRMKPRLCPSCKQTMSKDLLLAREKERVIKIKVALKMADKKGRPRSVDYNEIMALRKKGLSIKQICELLSTSARTVSRGSVQHAMRLSRSKQNER